jgi:hypothetical protein
LLFILETWHQRCSTRVQDLDSSPVFSDLDLRPVGSDLRPKDLDLTISESEDSDLKEEDLGVDLPLWDLTTSLKCGTTPYTLGGKRSPGRDAEDDTL